MVLEEIVPCWWYYPKGLLIFVVKLIKKEIRYNMKIGKKGPEKAELDRRRLCQEHNNNVIVGEGEPCHAHACIYPFPSFVFYFRLFFVSLLFPAGKWCWAEMAPVGLGYLNKTISRILPAKTTREGERPKKDKGELVVGFIVFQ